MCSALLLDYENVGCEQILIDARKIMADKKVCNVGKCYDDAKGIIYSMNV